MAEASRSSAYAIVMWSTLGGFLSSAITGAVAYSIQRLLPAEFLGHAASAQLSNAPEALFIFMATLAIPLLETLIGTMAPVELGRAFRAGNLVCIVLAASVFAVGHFLNGGVGHAVASAVGGAIFALAYLAFRSGGTIPAIAASWICHGTNNLFVILLWSKVMP
jgi:membrane protease YdiL (CAAX protease family)